MSGSWNPAAGLRLRVVEHGDAEHRRRESWVRVSLPIVSPSWTWVTIWPLGCRSVTIAAS